MPTPRIERETILTFNEEEDDAMVWSASPMFQRHMARFKIEPCQTGQRGEAGILESWSYRIPKGWVKVRLPKMLSPEQRERLQLLAAERFRKKDGLSLTVEILSSEKKDTAEWK